MSTANINAATLHYERTGHGPTILFVHGMCGDADVWADQVRRLSNRFECITYDRRGHSRSSVGDQPLTDTLHADDAAALIRHLSLDPCVIVGSSGGARICVDVARRYPELLRGAVFSEPPLFSINPDAGQQLMVEIKPRIEEAMADGGPPAAVDAFFTAVCPGLWSRIDEATRDRYRANAPMLFADLQSPLLTITTADLRAISVPTLVLAGDSSHPSLRSTAHTLAESLRDVRYLELHHCGHVTYAEQPEAFAQAVTTFASEVEHQSATPV